MPEHPVEIHIDSLRKFCLSLCKNRVLADDICQEALCKALAAWSSSEKQQLRSWLFKIAYNSYLDILKRPEFTLVDHCDIELADSCASSEEQLFNDELLQRFVCLSRQHREVLYLVAVVDMSYSETAEILRLPIGTVMSRLSRARKALNRLIAEP